MSDAAHEELPRRELRLQHRSLVGRHRDEQPTGGLRVVCERELRLREVARLDVRSGEVPIAAVAARPDARFGLLQRAGEERKRGGVELDPDAAPLRHLVRVPQQAETGDVRDRVRLERAERVGCVRG